MENLFNGLYLNLLVPLVFPSVQNMSVQDLDDKILSGNIWNASWYLCLLPALVKDCMLSYQLSCNQIATNRQDTVKAMRRISFWVPFYPLDYYESKAYTVLRPCTSSGLGGMCFPSERKPMIVSGFHLNKTYTISVHRSTKDHICPLIYIHPQ